MLKRDQIYLSATAKDTAAALSLMEGLERFEVPRTVQVAEGMEAMARRRRVMRHGQESPRVTELPALVIEKLGESAVMVLVCSSSSSTSRWIRAEVEEFYRTHPRGPVIPVVLDGEPDPDHSRQAFEKPCFPENLKKADVDRWVDGRATDWAETAPVAALARILGIRVEQIIHHEGRQALRLRQQRTLAWSALVSVLLLGALWTFRWPVHMMAKQKVPFYGQQWSAGMEEWLRSVDFGAPPGQGGAVALPEQRPAAEKTAEAVTKGSVLKQPGSADFLESLPKSDPVAYQLAVNAWLDEAEKYLPDQLDEAMRWIDRARSGLQNQDKLDFGNELYRVHALSAVVAQRRRDSDRSRQELLLAIDHWVAIPIQDLEKREEEGFNILTTIAPTQEWRESAIKMLTWLGGLPGDEVKVSQRAGRMIDLVGVHGYLAPAVESWLGSVAGRIQPAPADAVGMAAKFAMLRADLLRSRQDREGAVATLEQAERALAEAAQPASTLHRALAAQFRLRKAAMSGTAVAPPEMEKTLLELQEGQAVAGWEGWFGGDLRSGWASLGDSHLAQDGFAQAIGSYNRALEFSKNPEELAGILLKSGCAYRYQGDAAGAWDAFSLAIPIFEEAKDENSLLTALWGAVLAARDLKRAKEGAELQQRASQLQSKLGSSYQPPSYWRGEIGAVEFSAQPAGAGDAPAVPPGAPSGPVPAAGVQLVASASPQTKAASGAPGSEAAPATPPGPARAAGTAVTAASPAAGSVAADSPKEIEARIVTVQRMIAQLEADSKNRQTFRGLEELQNLYAELDSLLRRKLTGGPRQ